MTSGAREALEETKRSRASLTACLDGSDDAIWSKRCTPAVGLAAFLMSSRSLREREMQMSGSRTRSTEYMASEGTSADREV